jgi:hypothetical protein
MCACPLGLCVIIQEVKVIFWNMKNVFLKLMGCLIVAIALQSCSHDVYTVQELKAQYDDAFKSNVLNGDSIDPRQNWNASVMSTLNVTLSLDAGASYRVCVMTGNPLQNTSATLLSERTMTTGETAALHFAKPMALSKVYVAAINSKNRYDVYAVSMPDTVASVNIGADEATTSGAKGRTRIIPYYNSISTNSNDYKQTLSSIGSPGFSSSYYDISTMDAADYGKMDLYLYWPDSRYKYGDGYHYYVPAGKIVSGNLMYSNSTGSNCVIYVYGTLELPDGFSLTNGRQLVIAPGGRLILDGNAYFNSGARFINQGSIECSNGDISIQNYSGTYSDYYNSGTVTIPNGGFTVAGNLSRLYNNGTINVKYIDVGGTFTFKNFGTLNALSTSKSGFTTDDQSNAASNFILINACHTTINAMGVYQLVLCDNSRVDCSTGIYTGGGQYYDYIAFGSNSMVSAGDWHDNGGDFYGYSSKKKLGVFRFTGNLTMDNSFTSSGYVYYDGDFSQKSSYSSNTNYWIARNYYYEIQYTSVENVSTISLPAGDCMGTGYNSDDGTAPTPAIAPTIYYYAFEDLGSVGDYDFNDVIVGVKYPVVVGNQVNADIYLVAAGGTLATSVLYNGNTICDEVHQTFGVSTSTMVNTYSSTQYPEHLLTTLTNVGNNFNASNLPISIFVNGVVSTEISGNNSTGVTPQMIKVPSPWKWAKETTNISDAYSTPGYSFGAWGSNYAANTTWYLYPIEDRVVQ